jgi:hypothetical protein
MVLIREFRTAAEFWAGMVEPDYQAALANPADLRAAFHAAISLFHLHDWVWHSHESQLRGNFSFRDAAGTVVAVHTKGSFAKSLEQICEDFGQIWNIANAAKHLQITDIRAVPNAASHAADTAVHLQGGASGGYGVGAIGYGVAGSYARLAVILEGPPGQELEFRDVAQAVHGMWSRLRAQYGWW